MLKCLHCQRKNQARKCSEDRTISMIYHTGKIVALILSKSLESKIEAVIEEDIWTPER